MIVYPAIDIRGGHAVRLVEGDYARETVFDSDPVAVARRWAEAGAEWIHIVDLDGARDGHRSNAEAIARIRDAVSCQLQIGGGIRIDADVEELLSLGMDRLVIGSAAVTNPDFVRRMVESHGDHIAVGLDARDGRLAIQGWREQSSTLATDAAARFADMGIAHIIFTDIARDGRLEGPNLDALNDMIRASTANVIASGGISSLDDVRAVQETGASGVVIGAALYHNAFSLKEALEITQ